MRKYLIYAVGEIILIVLGILIAVYLNNWNASNQQKEEFSGFLDQLYSGLQVDTDELFSNVDALRVQEELINKLLTTPDAIELEKLPYTLFYLDEHPLITFNSASLIPLINHDSEDFKQNEIIKQFLAYSSNLYLDERYLASLYEQVLSPKLRAAGIPQPDIAFRFSEYQNFAGVDHTFFTTEEMASARRMITNGDFKVELKTLQSYKRALSRSINEGLNTAVSLQQKIEAHYPDVKLLSDNIGIIGNALETGWSQSAPMTVKDSRNTLWEIEIELQDGFVKFRNGNDWNQNWGGRSFPTGNALSFGENIPVRAGTYRVQLDLKERTYAFTVLE